MEQSLDFRQFPIDFQKVLLELIASGMPTLSSIGKEMDRILLAPTHELVSPDGRGDPGPRGAFCMQKIEQNVLLSTQSEMGGGWDSYVVDESVYDSMIQQESMCWVKVPPFTNTTLTVQSLQQNLSSRLDTCLRGGLKQITKLDTNKQLEHLVSRGADSKEEYEYTDEYGQDRHLYKLDGNGISLLTAFQIETYASVCPRDDSRVRVLLRGTVANMNRMSMVQQFVETWCPRLCDIATTDIQRLVPFVERNVDVLRIELFVTVLPGYIDVIRFLFQYYTATVGRRNGVTIFNLPRHTWPS